jgi:hypothetical protein
MAKYEKCVFYGVSLSTFFFPELETKLYGTQEFEFVRFFLGFAKKR